PSSRSSRIPVPATLAGVPEPLPPPRTVAEAAATPIQLTLNPPSVIVQPAGSFDLRANVQALADFSDQTTRDVSRDVLYGNPSGGTLAGNDFKPSAGAAAGSVTVSFIRGNRTVSSVLAIGVAPGKPRTTALILSPAGATLTPGAVYVLAANVQALARLATGTTSDVSSLVTFGSPTGGKLKGGSFVAGPPGAGSVIATLRLDSQTVTATFGFTISLNEPRPVALAARPPSLAPATRAPVDLSGALRFDATFEDGSSQDVTGATSLVDATGGSLTGTFFTFAAGVGAGSVTASLAARALTTSIAAGSTLDLMASVVASVRLSDGTTRDVSHEVGYTAASGGTLTGSLLSASPGAAAVALRVGFPAAAPTLVATFALAVTGPPPVPTALTATSAVATVAAGSLFGLRENLAVTATFTAGPPRSVSAVVAFSRPTGGMLVGDSFLAGNGAGPASVLLTFVSNGAGVTATFSFDVTSTASPAVSLAVSPAAVTVAAGSRFSLAAAIRATSRRADGTTTDVTRELRFDTPVGGTLSGTEFVSATDRSAGSVRVTLPGCGRCTATVSFVIQAVGAAVPVSLALRPERVAVESGGALDLREVVGALATLSNGDVEDVSGRLAFSDPSGGTLSGTVFQVAFGVSAGSVLATYTRNGSSARAPFAFSVASGERVPVALTLSPAVLGVVEGAPCDLRSSSRSRSAGIRFRGRFDSRSSRHGPA
ncbi:MAG: hypothetical protein HY303_02825, partial [Candidatus Wallbacteria bacterium]|nr:hypothetical protein [Candidatus Wallbacteria bacterium]